MTVYADDISRQRVRQAYRSAVDLIAALARGDDGQATALAETLRAPFVTSYVLASIAAGFVQEAAEAGGITVDEALEHLANRMERETP
jgi:hypothetical protein